MQLATLQVTCEGPLVLRHSLSTALPFDLRLLYTPSRDLSIGFLKKVEKILKMCKKGRKKGKNEGSGRARRDGFSV